MTSWILTFAIITMVNGRPVVHEHTAPYMTGPEQCLSVLRTMQRSLPRTARISRAACREVWMT